MFHNSTTIWHNPYTQKNLFKEKRLVNVGAKETAKGIWAKTKGFFRGVKKVATFGPIGAGINVGVKGVQGAIRATRWSWAFGGALGKGVLKATVGAAAQPAQAPLILGKKAVYDNTRDGIKGVFSLPQDIKNTPKMAWEETVKTLKNIPAGAQEGWSEITSTPATIRDNLKEALSLNPLNIIKGTRSAIWNTIKLPFKMLKPAGKIAWNTAKLPFAPFYGGAKSLFRTPIKMTRNLAEGILAGPKGIRDFFPKIREGIKETLGAYATANAAMPAREKEPNKYWEFFKEVTGPPRNSSPSRSRSRLKTQM